MVYLKGKEMALCNVPLNKECFIYKLQLQGKNRRRIMDLGLLPGTKVLAVMESPFGRLRAYMVRGAVIALRNKDSKDIITLYQAGE